MILQILTKIPTTGQHLCSFHARKFKSVLVSALPGQPFCLRWEGCVWTLAATLWKQDKCSSPRVSLRLGWEARAGSSLPIPEGNILSAPKGYLAGFKPAESKKETCAQLDQLFCNKGGETKSQMG